MRSIGLFIVTITIVCVDMVTKILFHDQRLWAGEYFLSPNFNTGVARSLPVPLLLIGSITVFSIGIIVYRYYKKQLSRWLAAILLGGIIGNAYDRLFLGGVRDFIAVGSFPVFNVADIAISIGVGLLVLTLLYPGKYRAKN